MPQDTSYTIVDLSRLTGLNVRTIRYYLAQGLIPASGESGPGAHYGTGHLDRLRLIKLLQTQYLPNAEIRRRLQALSDDDVAALVAAEVEQPAAPDTTALEYVRNVLGQSQVPGAQESMPTRAYRMGVPPPAPAAGAPVLRSPSRLSPPMAAPGREPDTAALPATPAMPAMRDVVASSAAAEAADSHARMGMGRAAAQEPADTADPKPGPERSQWERLSLGDNIELHIRRPLSRLEQRRVERLITIARQVLDEDQG